jgi:ribosome-binding factor A
MIGWKCSSIKSTFIDCLVKEHTPVKRATRVASLLREVLSEILATQLKDPSVGRITISRVSLTDDLRNAKVYFSSLSSESERQQTLAGLGRASGFIRNEISKRMALKFAPTLQFIYDDSVDRADRINALLKQVRPPDSADFD